MAMNQEESKPNEKDREIEALIVRIKALEEALADYAARYGLTDRAREVLCGTKSAD